MTPKAARIHLACQPPPGDQQDEDIRSALDALQNEPEALQAVESQWQTDRQASAILKSVELPGPVAEQLAESARMARHARGKPRWNPTDPAALSVALGVLLLAALLIWHFVGKNRVFPEDALTIASESVKNGSEQFDIVNEKAGALEDWFLLKGFEKFRVPPQFTDFHAEGARIFRVENQPVALLAIPEHYMFFLVFDPDDFGLSLNADGSWVTTEFDVKYAAAMRLVDGMCFMVVIKGSKQELEALINHKG